MSTRRDFLRRTSLAIAGGLIVGDAALELMERLTHRKVFALGGMPRWLTVNTGAMGGTFSFVAEEVRHPISGVLIDGQRADIITELGRGPNGGRLFRASRWLGPGPCYVVNGDLIREQFPPNVRGIHAQLEDSRWPTSPIVTHNIPVTRRGDRLNFNISWKPGPLPMTGPLPGSTPIRHDYAGRVLVEKESVNYVLYSGDPRPLSSEGK